MSDFLQWLSDAADARERAGLVRRLRSVKSGELLDLAGNDYLGLREHPAVIAGAVAAAETYGAGAGASRLVTGTLDIHEELESALSQFTGAPTALVFSTGYHANLSALAGLADAGTLVISDAHAHASLIDGCRLSRAAVAVNRHNDLDHVERLLAERESPRALVVAESIYSVLGDAAPVADLVALTAEYGAVLVLDEAHAIGVAGERGEGLLAATGCAGADHVVMTTTLSKSLAAQGGAVLAHPRVREHLVNTARPFIFDTGLAPAAVAGAGAALEVLEAEPSLAKAVRARAAGLSDDLLAAGLRATAPDAAVVSVLVGDPGAAADAAARLLADGLRVGCFRPPSVPDGVSRLRLTARADLTDAEAAHAVGAVAGVLSS